MTEQVPSEVADLERLVCEWERLDAAAGGPDGSAFGSAFARLWRANVRPVEPTDLPAGESLLRDEQGVAVFRPPEEGEEWVGMCPTNNGVQYLGVCSTGLDDPFFGGRRFILAAPKPTTAERIAADVQAGITRYGLLAAADMGEVTRTVTNVLVERGYKHPEET